MGTVLRQQAEMLEKLDKHRFTTLSFLVRGGNKRRITLTGEH
jgi:hypothetical protein